jgi:lysozyme family protein
MYTKEKIFDMAELDFAKYGTIVTDIKQKQTKMLDFSKFGDIVTAPFRKKEVFSTDSLMDSLFKSEGGYQNNKNDTGNYYKGQLIGTNFGVSAPILATYLGRTPTVKDMKNLTREDARKIAKINYYDKFMIEKLPVELREIVFHSVYLGESRGVKALQELLGVDVDGIVGPKTTAAMSNASFTKEEFKEKFLGRLKKLDSWSNFGKGWTNRFEELST